MNITRLWAVFYGCCIAFFTFAVPAMVPADIDCVEASRLYRLCQLSFDGGGNPTPILFMVGALFGLFFAVSMRQISFNPKHILLKGVFMGGVVGVSVFILDQILTAHEVGRSIYLGGVASFFTVMVMLFIAVLGKQQTKQ